MEKHIQYDDQQQEIRYRKTNPYEVIIAVLLSMIGLSISFMYNFMGAALAVLGLWIFVKHFLGRGTLITRFLPAAMTLVRCISFQPVQEDRKNLLVLLPRQFYQPRLTPGFEKFYHHFLYIYTFSTGFSIFWLYIKPYLQNDVLFLIVNICLFGVMATFIVLYLSLQWRLNKKGALVSEKILNRFLKDNKIKNLHLLIKPDVNSLTQLVNYIEEQEQFRPDNTIVMNVDRNLNDTVNIVLEEGVILVRKYLEFNHLTGFPRKINRTYCSDLLPFTNSGFAGFTVKANADAGVAGDIYRIAEEVLK
ncbi:MAG: hypothetical protein ACLFQM_06305 [Fidelibacterota bacterium]